MKSKLLNIFLIVFIDLLGFGIVIPILPYYATSFGASAFTLGLLMMSYSLMQFIFAPMWGSLSDRIGRRPVLLTCIAGISASMLLLGLAKSLVWLFIGRILAGFFGANISAASAYIADITTPENRAKGMGIIGASFGLGFLFGPALGGILSKWGYGTAPLVAAALSLMNFFFAFATLAEPNLTRAERSSHRMRFNMKHLKHVFSHPTINLGVTLFFFVTLCHAQLETVFAIYLLKRFILDAMHAGLILALMAVFMVIIQGGLIGKFNKRFGELKLIRTGLPVMALMLAFVPNLPSLLAFILLMCVYSVAYAFTNPSLMSLVSRSAGSGEQGATMGVYQSAGSLGRIFGPLLAGFTFSHVHLGDSFYVAAIFLAAAYSLLAFRLNLSKRVAS